MQYKKVAKEKNGFSSKKISVSDYCYRHCVADWASLHDEKDCGDLLSVCCAFVCERCRHLGPAGLEVNAPQLVTADGQNGSSGARRHIASHAGGCFIRQALLSAVACAQHSSSLIRPLIAHHHRLFHGRGRRARGPTPSGGLTSIPSQLTVLLPGCSRQSGPSGEEGSYSTRLTTRPSS